MRFLRGILGEAGVTVAVGIGFTIGVVAIGVGGYYRIARNVPMIHDIATDPADPPAFVALLPERNASWNGAAYGGPPVAAAQRGAYPDIGPIEAAMPPAAAFDRALAAARGLGWRVADADAAAGRIEATDTTRIFRFRDDVVIRVRPVEGGNSRVDVRSASRVGLGDLGTNAARVRAFAARFAAEGAPVTREAPGPPGPSLPGASPPSRLSRNPGSG